MVRPLQKTARNGQRYSRPPRIETAIAEALELPTPNLVRRARIIDLRDGDFLPMECLVHLVREANRSTRYERRDELLLILLSRCESMIAAAAVDYRGREELVEAVLGEFTEILAEDFSAPKTQLDFFEVRFARALKTLRFQVLRGLTRHEAGLDRRQNDTRDTATAETLPLNTLETLRRADLQDPVQRMKHRDLLKRINELPEPERMAIALHHVLGYQIESKDPKQRTVATICNVTARTVNSRLRSGVARLRNPEEDDS